MDSDTKKYPKSVHNIQCIGPCYYPGTMIVHPIALQYLTNPDDAFCPIVPYENIDKITGKKETITADRCYHPTERTDLSGKEFEINILSPNIDFNNAQFLNIYYNILSFEDSVNYIDNKKYLPIMTRLRIIDCALNAFGYELSIFDNRIVNFFIDVINNKWIDELYNVINKYIKIDNDKILFTVSNKMNDSLKDKDVKYNFIKSKFVNSDEVYKFLSRYLKHRKGNWEQIKLHSENIKNDFIVYVENKIKASINQ